MARLAIAALTLILLAAGCGSAEEKGRSAAASPPRPVGPDRIAMAVHISRAHGVRVGADPGADITVTRTDDGIRMVMQPCFLERVDGRMMLGVLGISGTELMLSPGEYVALLNKLHAYLMLTPPQPQAAAAQ